MSRQRLSTYKAQNEVAIGDRVIVDADALRTETVTDVTFDTDGVVLWFESGRRIDLRKTNYGVAVRGA